MADKSNNKFENWKKKRQRLKYRITQKNRSGHPRLIVFRSNTNIYAQLVDDTKDATILSASSMDQDLQSFISKAEGKIEKSKIVGNSIAVKMKKAKIERAIFDRNGYQYHGRIKAFTDAVRAADITI